MVAALTLQNVEDNSLSCSEIRNPPLAGWISYCGNTTFCDSNTTLMLLIISKILILSCKTRYKDTNLKAIHNAGGDEWGAAAVVKPDTKIQI